MSYRIKMNFVNHEIEESEFYDFINNYVKSLTQEKFDEVMNREEYFITKNLIESDLYKKSFKNMPVKEYIILNFFIENVVHDLFFARALYWPEYKLGGIIGGFVDDLIENKSMTSVCFQNSTDQDYDFSEWSDQIPLFHDCKMKFMNRELKDLDDGQDLEYLRRTMVYEEIYNKLCLDSIAYSSENINYKVFRICPPMLFDEELVFYYKILNKLIEMGLLSK